MCGGSGFRFGILRRETNNQMPIITDMPITIPATSGLAPDSAATVLSSEFGAV